ncbi:unnamed protein product [Ciceribacter sp. T2.26MG-112.2]|nr:unnamed protein product [Ciceribacter naphthalenivorans]
MSPLRPRRRPVSILRESTTSGAPAHQRTLMKTLVKFSLLPGHGTVDSREWPCGSPLI